MGENPLLFQAIRHHQKLLAAHSKEFKELFGVELETHMDLPTGFKSALFTMNVEDDRAQKLIEKLKEPPRGPMKYRREK